MKGTIFWSPEYSQSDRSRLSRSETLRRLSFPIVRHAWGTLASFLFTWNPSFSDYRVMSPAFARESGFAVLSTAERARPNSIRAHSGDP
jgi:hypothetical protein